MPDGSNVITLPTRLSLVENCGPYGYPAPEPVLPVELDGNRVLIRGRLFATFMSESNAARMAAALWTFEALGKLDTVRMPEPPKECA